MERVTPKVDWASGYPQGAAKDSRISRAKWDGPKAGGSRLADAGAKASASTTGCAFRQGDDWPSSIRGALKTRHQLLRIEGLLGAPEDVIYMQVIRGEGEQLCDRERPARFGIYGA